MTKNLNDPAISLIDTSPGVFVCDRFTQSEDVLKA